LGGIWVAVRRQDPILGSLRNGQGAGELFIQYAETEHGSSPTYRARFGESQSPLSVKLMLSVFQHEIPPSEFSFRESLGKCGAARFSRSTLDYNYGLESSDFGCRLAVLA